MQVVSRLDAGGGLTIIHLKEVESLDPILNFDEIETVDVAQTPSVAFCLGSVLMHALRVPSSRPSLASPVARALRTL